MPDRVGQQIGNYRLVKLLGQGGFAEVYLGQHVHLASKQAAIKILHLIDVDVKKFREEAETTEKLVHPHIVRLLDFALEDGTPFLVLDFAPGGSLRSRHPKGSIVPLDIVSGYLKEIAPALQYAHDQHFLHRDMKPDNVLIGRGGELLVSDFGIAVLSQSGRTTSSSAYDLGGTPYYMAPETYRGKPVKESDQYALAVMVYEWLCGSVPFGGGNFIQLGYQHTYESVPLLREKNPTIFPAVEQVVMTALAKDPKQRFASVQAFATALEQASHPTRVSFSHLPMIVPPFKHVPRPIQLASSSGQVASSQAPSNQTSKPSRRLVVVGLASLAVVGVAGGSLLWLEHGHPQPPVSPPLDFPMFGFDPQHSHYNQYENTLTSAKVSKLVLIRSFPCQGRVNCSPIIVRDTIYATTWTYAPYGPDTSGFVYAFNAQTGDLRRFSIGVGSVSTPAIVNGMIYFTAWDSSLYALDAQTMQVRWKFHVPWWRADTSPTVANGVVYFGSDRGADINAGYVYALNATTGEKLWSFYTGSENRTSPAISKDVVYFGTFSPYVYAVGAKTGKQVWKFQVDEQNCNSSPTVVNEVVYIGSSSADQQSGKLYAIHAQTGKKIWATKIGGVDVVSPAVAHGLVYIGCLDSKVYAVDATTGDVRWTFSTGGGSDNNSGPIAGLTVANDVIYFGSWYNNIYALNAITGESLWSYTTNGELHASPTIVNGKVYVGSFDGNIYEFGLKS